MLDHFQDDKLTQNFESSVGKVHPLQLHGHAAQPQPGDESRLDWLAGWSAGEFHCSADFHMNLIRLQTTTEQNQSKKQTVVGCVDLFFFFCLLKENFELYHETLYLAVKMTDHYLSKVPIQREMLQLIGSTAMLIASKFEVSLNYRNLHCRPI